MLTLYAITNYVNHFFGCRDCAEHFRAIAAGIPAEMRSLKHLPQRARAELWLWGAHNQASRHAMTTCASADRMPKIR